MSYRLSLLGRFELLSPSGESIAISSKKNQVLIARLALAGGNAVLRAQLSDLLWEDRGEEQARSSLRQAFTALRKVFKPHGVFPFKVTEDDAAIDIQTFHADVHFLADGQHHGDLETTIQTCREEFLSGLNVPGRSVQNWLRAERQRFHAMYADLLSRRLGELEESGELAQAMSLAQALIEADPLSEAGHRTIMRGHAKNGDRVKALKQYQICCDALQSELGLVPDTSTRQLFDTIRQDGATQAMPRTQAGAEHSDGSPDVPGVAVLPFENLSEDPDEGDIDHMLDGLRKAGLEDDPLATETPSIVVLPFKNLSGDPDQEYFCDGMTDNVISDLSRFRDLFVISCTSSWVYKDHKVDVQEICRELSVGYGLEGSVQRAGDRVRINVQLIDGANGRQMWSERYDRLLEDVFAIQDEVTDLIVATLGSGFGGRLRKAWQDRHRTTRPNDVKAFDCFMRGLDAVDLFTPQGNARGRELLNQAISIDPGYARAYGKLAWTYMLDAVEGWGNNRVADMVKAHRCALKSLELDDGDAWSHWALSGWEFYSLRHDQALNTIEKALDLNPNDADVLTDYGLYLSYAGRNEEAVEAALRALRLNPHSPEWFTLQLVQIYFDARRYQDAITTTDSLRIEATPLVCLYVAASYAALGNADQARKALGRLLKIDPKASLNKWISTDLAPYKHNRDLDHLRENLCKAGLQNI